MSNDKNPIDWSKTTFASCRREQLWQVQIMTVYQRLEGLDQLTKPSERLQAMRDSILAEHASRIM